jgi:hypothetical protein
MVITVPWDQVASSCPLSIEKASCPTPVTGRAGRRSIRPGIDPATICVLKALKNRVLLIGPARVRFSWGCALVKLPRESPVQVQLEPCWPDDRSAIFSPNACVTSAFVSSAQAPGPLPEAGEEARASVIATKEQTIDGLVVGGFGTSREVMVRRAMSAFSGVLPRRASRAASRFGAGSLPLLGR